MFEGRTIAIATMHRKEKVIAPLLSTKMGMYCIVADINTDKLGTFSGEVPRTDSPYEAARKKCEIAMAVSGCDIAISSEGSFGAHPYIFFAHANEELVLLLDRKNKKEFFGQALTTETNFAGQSISSIKEATDFAEKVGFPSHAVILKDQENNFKDLVKGINSMHGLNYAMHKMLSDRGSVWIETDMRAMNNPTRMTAIEKATENLIAKLNSFCPQCNFPGFWIAERRKGLPCSDCGFPTKSIIAHRYQCDQCYFESYDKYPNQKFFEEPMYCDVCNP
jgi:hypothetical protein